MPYRPSTIARLDSRNRRTGDPIDRRSTEGRLKILRDRLPEGMEDIRDSADRAGNDDSKKEFPVCGDRDAPASFSASAGFESVQR